VHTHARYLGTIYVPVPPRFRQPGDPRVISGPALIGVEAPRGLGLEGGANPILCGRSFSAPLVYRHLARRRAQVRAVRVFKNKESPDSATPH